jgi:hypothetical protein
MMTTFTFIKPMKTRIIFSVTCLFLMTQTHAQVVVNEGFDYATGMPSQLLSFGWIQNKVNPSTDPENYVLRTNTSVYAPIHGTHSGAGMLRYRSYDVNSGEASYVASRPFDLRARGAVSSTFSFYFYRENTWQGFPDNIQVFINNAPDLAGATLLPENGSGLTAINRDRTMAPVVGTDGWYQYTYTVPAGAAWNIQNLYVIIRFNSGYGNDMFLDAFSIQTYPQNPTVQSYGLIYQNTSNVGIGSSNNLIVGANIVLHGESTTWPMNQVVFNLLGVTTNYNGDIASARIFWTGGTNTFDINFAQQLGATINNPFASSNITFTPAATFRPHNGDNYIWLVYNILGTATAGNYVDGEFVSFTFNSIAYNAPSPATLPGGREIDLPYCIPTYLVGTAWNSYTNNDYINHVILNGEPGYPVINNNLNSQGPNIAPWFGGPCPFSAHPPDYERFPAVPGKTTTLKVGSVYTIQAQVGTYWWGNCLAAWIDYNRDGDFYDSGEKLGETPYPPGLNGSGWWSQNFTVPTNPVLGATLLRVRETWITSNVDPCNTYTYGETEDYTVTIIPDCNILPGWRVWLGGFSDDWDNPLNWCGGVPTLGSDAAILPDIDINTPGIQRPDFMPVIKQGVAAETRRFMIVGDDTLTCNAHINASFTAAGDSVSIQNSGSMWKIISNLRDSVKLYLGTLNNTNVQPITQATIGYKQRSVTVFTEAELLATGMKPGDVIDTITFTFFARNSTAPYNNFTITLWYTIPGWTTPLTPPCGAGSWPPVDVGSKTIVFNGNIDLSVPGPYFVPTTGGKLRIPITPWQWSGTNGRDLVVEICYDNAASTSADQMHSTQLIGLRKYMRIANQGVTPVGGCNLNPCDQNTVRHGVENRPNIQFHYRRIYEKFPINLNRGDWINRGTFIAGRSRVTFQATAGQIQKIAGTSITTFCDVTVNTALNVRLDQDAVIDSVLTLQSGRLLLNSWLLTLKYGIPSAMTRIAGFLQSETAPPAAYSRIRWMIGNNTGSTYLFPFINAGGVYIPFTYTPVSGTTDLTVATYPTNPANLPWPVGVTNINNYYTQSDNSANMVDRFWILTNIGTATANITFRFAPAESAGAGTYWSQRYDPVLGWRPYTPGQSYNAVLLENTSPGIAEQNTPWALTLNTQPLPVELLSFTARAVGKRVKLDWITASEMDNDRFVIDRTTDGREFTYIGERKSLGNGSQLRSYTLFDEKPLPGLQYYRLTEADINGHERSHPMVPVIIRSEMNIVNVYESNESSITVVFNYNSDLPYNYRLLDITGRVIDSGERLNGTEGINYLEIKRNVARGVYTILISNEAETVSRKFVY